MYDGRVIPAGKGSAAGFAVAAIALLNAVACGRIGFDAEASSSSDAALDARDSGGIVDRDGGCTPAAELCNGRDDDCDTAIDEDFELSSDVTNCGSCGMVCPDGAANGVAVCRAETCALDCDPGFDDCNDVAADGCEADLLDAATCGACTAVCAMPTALCVDGSAGPVCAMDCPTALTRCVDSCVNTSIHPLHCGSCGMVCPSPERASPSCTGGACGYVCDPGWADCDGLSRNGCETALGTLAHCSGCGDACELPFAIAGCAELTCVVAACTGTRANCDGNDANGCETEGIAVWPDRDLDNDGDELAEPAYVCEVRAGMSTTHADCDDDDGRVFPGQTAYFAEATARGSFDYNCDDVLTARWRATMLCLSGPACLLGNEGWEIAPAPMCGAEALWVTDCTGTDPCTLTTELRKQECR